MFQAVVTPPRSDTYVGPSSARSKLIEELSLGRDLPEQFGIARDVMSHWKELVRPDTSASVLVPDQGAWAAVRRYVNRKNRDPRSVELRAAHAETSCDARSLGEEEGRLRAIENVKGLFRQLGISESLAHPGRPPRVGDLIAHEALFWASFGQLFTGSTFSTIRFVNGSSEQGNWHLHPTGFLGNNTPELISYITFGSLASRTTLFASQMDLIIPPKYSGVPVLRPGVEPLRYPPHSVVTSKFHYQPDNTYYYPDRPIIYESSPPAGSPRFTLGIGTIWDRNTIARRQELSTIRQLFTFDEYAKLRRLSITKVDLNSDPRLK
jgi:hypothetical protein